MVSTVEKNKAGERGRDCCHEGKVEFFRFLEQGVCHLEKVTSGQRLKEVKGEPAELVGDEQAMLGGWHRHTN